MDARDFNRTDSQMEDIELYDSERQAIARVHAELSKSIGHNTSLAGFVSEAEDRFGAIGFLVHVDLYDAEDPRTGQKFVMPQISIIGRTEKQGEFDHARQAHEVQTDLLGQRRGEDIRASKPVHVSGSGGFKKSSSGLLVPGK